MLTLLDAAGRYELPTGWHEVTTRQYCDLDRLQLATVEARASYFAGRPIQVNTRVADCLAFLLSEPPTDGGLPYPLDLGQETYLQIEEARQALQQRPLYDCFAFVYARIKARSYIRPLEEFSYKVANTIEALSWEWPITDTYPALAHYQREMQRLATSFKELAEPDKTAAGDKARQAGADELLAMFGHFGVADHLAEKKGRPLDEIYQTPWQTVAMWLLKDRRTAILADNLQRLPTGSE